MHADMLSTVIPTVIFLGVPGLLYIGLLGAVAAVIEARRHPPHLWTLWRSVAISVGVFILAIMLFEVVASSFRHSPPGSGMERQRGDRREYVAQAEAAWFTTYTLVLALSGVIGYVSAARVAAGRFRWAALVVTMSSVLTFMLATLLWAEFLNSCFVGQSFVLPADVASC